MKDYYTILGVDRGASQEDIQKAFRKMAHQYHPDKKGGDVNKFKEVNEAYQILSNEQKRAQYDAGIDHAPPVPAALTQVASVALRVLTSGIWSSTSAAARAASQTPSIRCSVA